MRGTVATVSPSIVEPEAVVVGSHGDELPGVDHADGSAAW
jgi:hypothetical protein